MMQKISEDIPFYSDPVYQPPPKPIPMPEFPGKMNINPEFNTDFEENSPFQEGVISKTYKGQINHFFKNLKNWKVLLIQAG